jgi:hypothetical protein
VKLLLILLLPITLFFHRNLDYANHLGYYSIYLWYIVLIIFILIILFGNLTKARKSVTRGNLFWIGLSSFVLVLCILLGKEIIYLREIATFQMHRENFSELVELARNAPPEKDIEDTNIEIPKRDQEWTGQSSISVFRSPENSLRLVALSSRPDTLFVYLPDQKHQPKNTLYFQYGYGVNCFYKLADYWFVCSIWH